MTTLRDIGITLNVVDDLRVTARRLWVSSRDLAIAVEVARILRYEDSSLLHGSYVVTRTLGGYEHRLRVTLPKFRDDVDITLMSVSRELSTEEMESLYQDAVEQTIAGLQDVTLPPAGRKIGGPVIQAVESILGDQP